MTNVEDATVWTITKDTNSENEPRQYTISADGLRIGVVAPSAEDRDHRLPGEPENGPSYTTWMLEKTRSLYDFTIKGVRNFKDLVVDLTSEDRVILWEVNSHPNQSWAIHPYVFNTPRIEPGTYRIRLGTGIAAKYLALRSGTDVILKDLDMNDASQRWKIKHYQSYNFIVINEDGNVILAAAKTPSGGRIPHGGLGTKELWWSIEGVVDTGTYVMKDDSPYGQVPTLLHVVNDEVVLSWEGDSVWRFEKL